MMQVTSVNDENGKAVVYNHQQQQQQEDTYHNNDDKHPMNEEGGMNDDEDEVVEELGDAVGKLGMGDGVHAMGGEDNNNINHHQQQHHPHFALEDKCKLFVGQIPKSWDSKTVFELFKDYGVQECSIITDRITGRHCSCAFVRVTNESDGQRAIEHFHNKVTIPPMKNPLQVRVASHSANSRLRSNSSTNSSIAGRGSDLTSTTSASGGQHLHGFGSFSSMSTNTQENKSGKAFNAEIHEQCKIFIVNSTQLTEDELNQLFSQFGKIVSVLCLTKKHFPNAYQQQQDPKHCSIIAFENHEDAAKAVSANVNCPKTNSPMIIKWSKKQLQRNSNNHNHHHHHQNYYYQPYQDPSASNGYYGGIQYQGVYPSSSIPYIQMSQSASSNVPQMYYVPMDPNMMAYQAGSGMMMFPIQQQQQQQGQQNQNQQQQQQQSNQQQVAYIPGYYPNQMFLHAYSQSPASYMQSNQQIYQDQQAPHHGSPPENHTTSNSIKNNPNKNVESLLHSTQ